MRDIRFRGKRIDNGEWVYGDICHHDGVVSYIGQHPADGAMVVHDLDPATIGQFTGLLDKNGKGIYEGDVVRAVALSNDHHQRGAAMKSTIEYWMGNACLAITHVPLFPFIVDHEFEVIGNVHDNPELLEGVA